MSKALLICFAEREEACQHPPYLMPCRWQQDENATSQARSVKQRSLAAKAEAACFHGPGEKIPSAVPAASSRRRAPGAAPPETNRVCRFPVSQNADSKSYL